MKIAATILISLYLVLTLFALYQYKAKNRQWGMTMMGWLGLSAMLVGMKIRFNSFMVPVSLGFGFCLAYFVGWRLIGNRLSGWRQHLVRGIAFAVCLGPLAAVRLVDLERCFQWMDGGQSDVDGTMVIHFFLFGLPGFLLVGSIAFLTSLCREFFSSDREVSWSPPKRWKPVAAGVSMLLVLCINWYVAGTMDIHYLVNRYARRRARYIALSRPGIGNALDDRSTQALCVAVMREDAVLVRLMLWGGADATGKLSGVKPRSKGGKMRYPRSVAKNYLRTPPLHCAASRMNREIVSLLIAHGAPVNSRDDYGNTPLDLSFDIGHIHESEQFREWFRDRGANFGYALDYPFHQAVACGGLGTVEILLAEGTDINSRDNHGQTAAHIAILWDRRAMLDRLVPRGLSLEITNHSGLTPLMCAAKHLEPDMATALLRLGADIRAKDKRGWTAIHHAAKDGREASLLILLEAGADPNATTKKYASPLGLAIQSASVMISYPGPSVEVTDSAFESAEVLIENGAAINATHNGRTILDRSILMRWPKEIINFLRQHGAKTAKELEASKTE